MGNKISFYESNLGFTFNKSIILSIFIPNNGGTIKESNRRSYCQPVNRGTIKKSVACSKYVTHCDPFRRTFCRPNNLPKFQTFCHSNQRTFLFPHCNAIRFAIQSTFHHLAVQYWQIERAWLALHLP